MEEVLMASLQRDCAGDGANLYRHLCELIGTCVDKKDPNVLDKFEKISMELKYQRFRPPASPYRKKHLNPNPLLEDEKIKRRARLMQLVDGEKKSSKEDFLAEGAVLKNAGLGFSQQENYMISLKLNEIAKKDDVVSVRFWGKMLGTEADYLVYEASLEGEGLPSEEAEKRGYGANQYTYFVQNDPLSELTQLPDVSPEEIKSSRLISKLLSGDLNGNIIACPWFSGKEVHLLRAQIARISGACTLHTAGYYVISEETGKVVKAEAYTPVSDLTAQGSWVHVTPYILRNGRTSYPDPETLRSDEAREELAAEMEQNPVIPLLTSIQEDEKKDEDGSSLAWSIKQFGDKSTYQFGDVTRTYTLTLLSSTRWPGAYTVYQTGKCYNIYLGYGLRSDMNPIMKPYIGAIQLGPDVVQTEPADLNEMPEPNPEHEDEASDGGDEDQVGNDE